MLDICFFSNLKGKYIHRERERERERDLRVGNEEKEAGKNLKSRLLRTQLS